jgi:hypothetical protein
VLWQFTGSAKSNQSGPDDHHTLFTSEHELSLSIAWQFVLKPFTNVKPEMAMQLSRNIQVLQWIPHWQSFRRFPAGSPGVAD